MWNTLRLKSTNPQTRQKAVHRLAASKSLRAVELLIACLCDEDAMVRRTAAHAFNSITDERALNSLIAALDDASCDVRIAAASALGQQGNLRGIAPLVRTLRDCKSRVRHAAAGSLRKLGWKPTSKLEHAHFEIALGNPKAAMHAGHEAIAPLTAELATNTSFFRRAVAEVLKDLNDPRAVSSLLHAARFDSDIAVRIAAIYGLANVNHEQVIPVLERGRRGWR